MCSKLHCVVNDINITLCIIDIHPFALNKLSVIFWVVSCLKSDVCVANLYLFNKLDSDDRTEKCTQCEYKI